MPEGRVWLAAKINQWWYFCNYIQPWIAASVRERRSFRICRAAERAWPLSYQPPERPTLGRRNHTRHADEGRHPRLRCCQQAMDGGPSPAMTRGKVVHGSVFRAVGIIALFAGIAGGFVTRVFLASPVRSASPLFFLPRRQTEGTKDQGGAHGVGHRAVGRLPPAERLSGPSRISVEYRECRPSRPFVPLFLRGKKSGLTTIPASARKILMPDLTGSTNNKHDQSHEFRPESPMARSVERRDTRCPFQC